MCVFSMPLESSSFVDRPVCFWVELPAPYVCLSFPEAVVADALSFPWIFLSVMFAFPPPVLLPAALSKFCLEQVPLLLVRVSWLLASLGIQTFLELLFTFSLSFPLVSKVLFLAHWSHEDRQPSWKLSGAPLLGLVPLRVEPPLGQSLTASGGFSLSHWSTFAEFLCSCFE